MFELFGLYAHFRIPYFTSSRVTYPIPPKPTILGIVASIIGKRRSEYMDYFTRAGTKVGLLFNPEVFNAKSMSFKRIGIKGGQPRPLVVPHTLIPDPVYTIFLAMENRNDIREIKGIMEKHLCRFNLYLGISECVGNYRYLCSSLDRGSRTKVKVRKLRDIAKDGLIKASGAVPNMLSDYSILIASSEGKSVYGNNDIAIYRMPVALSSNRKPTRYMDFFLSKNGMEFEVNVLPKSNAYGVEYDGKIVILY